MIEELLPKTELERAFVQALKWEPMRSWRRGTSELNTGHLGAAVGNYLALVRSYALSGNQLGCDETLDSINPYLKEIPVSDTLSAIRVLCCVISEIREETQDIEDKKALEASLTKSAVAFTTHIKQDKLAVTDALSLIKKSAEFDVISDYQRQQNLVDLHALIDNYRSGFLRYVIQSYKSELTTRDKEILSEPINIVTGIETPNEPPIAPIAEPHAEIEPELQRILDLAEMHNEPLLIMDLLAKLSIDLLNRGRHVQAIAVSKDVLRAHKKFLKSNRLAIGDIQILSNLGDRLSVRGFKTEACEFFFEAAMARILAKDFRSILTTEIMEMSIQAITSAQYDLWSAKFQTILRALELQKDESDQLDSLQTVTIFHLHLISTLSQPGAVIDLQGLSALKQLVDQCRELSVSPFFVDILPYVAELLKTRVDRKNLISILDLLWEGAYKTPAEKIFDTYIQPLALITEQLLGGSSAKTLKYYSRIFKHMQHSGLRQQQLTVFWKSLTIMRESATGHDSPSLLPLLGALGKQNFNAKSYQDCYAIIEKVKMMNLGDLSGINAGTETIPSCIKALLTLAEIEFLLPDGDAKHPNDSKLLDDVEKIVKANERYEGIEVKMRVQALKFMASILDSGSSQRLSGLIQRLERMFKSKEF